METRVLPTLHFFPNLPNAGTLLIPVNNTLLLIKRFFFQVQQNPGAAMPDQGSWKPRGKASAKAEQSLFLH